MTKHKREDYELWKKIYDNSLQCVENILFQNGHTRVGQVEGHTDKIYKII